MVFSIDIPFWEILKLFKLQRGYGCMRNWKRMFTASDYRSTTQLYPNCSFTEKDGILGIYQQ